MDIFCFKEVSYNERDLLSIINVFLHTLFISQLKLKVEKHVELSIIGFPKCKSQKLCTKIENIISSIKIPKTSNFSVSIFFRRKSFCCSFQNWDQILKFNFSKKKVTSVDDVYHVLDEIQTFSNYNFHLDSFVFHTLCEPI